MKDLEDRIAELTRPAASADLDDRVAGIVKRSHRSKRFRRIGGWTCSVVACVVAFVLSTQFRSASQPDAKLTQTDAPVSATEIAIEPRLASLVLLSDEKDSLWGVVDASWKSSRK